MWNTAGMRPHTRELDQYEKAARLLGVTIGDGEATIKAAFRTAVKADHPDAGGEAVDMDALKQARDLLLSMAAARFPEGQIADNFNVKKSCIMCKGTGSVPHGFATATCSACGGSGVSR